MEGAVQAEERMVWAVELLVLRPELAVLREPLWSARSHKGGPPEIEELRRVGLESGVGSRCREVVARL